MFNSTTYRAWHGRHSHGRLLPRLKIPECSWSAVRAALYETGPAGVLPSGTVMRYEHPTEIAADYATKLADSLPRPLDYIRFGNTGSQMTEAAVMLSRFYRKMTGDSGRKYVITVLGGYHGTGPLATALTGEPVLQEYSAPLDRYVRHVVAPATDPHPSGSATTGADCDGACIHPVVDLIEEIDPDRVTAVMLEPVLGTIVQPVSHHYLNRLITECRSRSIHVIADKVTTGVGRAGAITVSERLAVTPDMIVLGKGLSAGYFPLAALAVSSSIYHELARSEHRVGFLNGSTTDGHLLGMAAGLAVLDVITTPGFFESVRQTGVFLRELIQDTFADEPTVREVGGEGLMLGVGLAAEDGTPWSVSEVNRFRLACRDHGLLASFSRGVLPLMPPLTISRNDCVELVSRLGKTLRELRPRKRA